MKVNFDNLRLNIQDSYNELISRLNTLILEAQEKDEDVRLYDYDMGQLAKELDSLRSEIATLLCTYSDTPEIINNISEQCELSALNFEG